MSAVASAKGRVLSGQQIRFSNAPVRLANHPRCIPGADRITVNTDPVTGDVTSIVVRCDCGEVITVECAYAGSSPQ
jgi:hypothetical protein